MSYQGIPGWIRRRKIEPGKYEVLRNGQVVGIAVLTGRYNVDDYPWDWYVVDTDTYGIDTGNAESLGRAIEDMYWKAMRPVEDAAERSEP